MKVVIVGGVAGGASCAARLRRLDEKAEIIMVNADVISMPDKWEYPWCAAWDGGQDRIARGAACIIMERQRK
jgi:NADPH-dependent 2,4-dienoyl-CoA reductase/sulfur reductase-like enzyme